MSGGEFAIPDDSDTRITGYGEPLGTHLIKPERDIMHQRIETLP